MRSLQRTTPTESDPVPTPATRPGPGRRPVGRPAGRTLATLLLFGAVAAPAPADPQAAGEAVPLPSRDQAEPSQPPPPKFATEPPAPRAQERVFYDDQGEHGLWARGETYKAGFSREGASYAPFLGSDAPRSYPVAFRVAHASQGGTEIGFDPAAAPALEGDTVRFARGGFDERYELSLLSIEQIFVFDELANRGELVLRIAAETELSPRETAEELRFENELGAVRYGRATAFDAHGRSVAAPTAWTAEGIEIRVPAEFLAGAALPLVIDPVVSTFSVDTSLRNSYLPDVAYDSALDRWLVAYEELFSSVDRDIHYRLLSGSGAFLHEDFAELSITQNWTNPAVAYNRRLARFLIVAETGFAPTRVIQGRLVTNAGIPSGPAIVLSVGDQGGDKLNPDVGGDPRTSGNTLFCVVWERVFSSTDRDIHYRMLSPEGFLQGTATQLLDNSGGTFDEVPSLSKSNGGTNWNLVWTRRMSPSDHDLRVARIGEAGNITAVPFFLAGSNLVDARFPSASSSLAGTNRWIVAHQFNAASSGVDNDILVFALDGTTQIAAFNLTGMEVVTGQSANWGEEQLGPDADSDGTSFSIVYAESFAGSSIDFDVYVSTATLTGNQLALTEGHKNLAFSNTREDYPAIASRAGSGGGLQRHLAVWHDSVDPATHLDVEGALYDAPFFTPFCQPALIWTIPCPCGNPPSVLDRGCDNSANTGGAKLTAFGAPSLANDTTVLSSQGMLSTALSVFNQGNAVLASSVAFGQGVRCVGGSLKRLYIKTASAGSSHAPQPGDPDVSLRSAQLGDTILPGSTRSYYVYYRDPVVLGGCPATSTFNTSQAIQAVWVP